jgi:hypothetical protein
MSVNETYIPNRLYMIALSELLPDPDQPRKYLGLTHDERDSFANALDALKQVIENKFQAMAQ